MENTGGAPATASSRGPTTNRSLRTRGGAPIEEVRACEWIREKAFGPVHNEPSTDCFLRALRANQRQSMDRGKRDGATDEGGSSRLDWCLLGARRIEE